MSNARTLPWVGDVGPLVLGAMGFERLSSDTRRLQRRATAADAMRKLLAGWHTIHVPLSLAMFTLVVIHVAIAVYYGAGMR